MIRSRIVFDRKPRPACLTLSHPCGALSDGKQLGRRSPSAPYVHSTIHQTLIPAVYFRSQASPPSPSMKAEIIHLTDFPYPTHTKDMKEGTCQQNMELLDTLALRKSGSGVVIIFNEAFPFINNASLLFERRLIRNLLDKIPLPVRVRERHRLSFSRSLLRIRTHRHVVTAPGATPLRFPLSS